MPDDSGVSRALVRRSDHSGGWRPRTDSSRRMARITGRFSAKAVTVARPIAESGTMVSPSQRKCFAHDCVRGLKSGTSSPDSGSIADCRAHFLSEHDTQARARLSSLVCPSPIGARCDRWGTPLPVRLEISRSTHNDCLRGARREFASAMKWLSLCHTLRAQPEKRQEFRQIN